MMTDPVWQPAEAAVAASNMEAFRHMVNAEYAAACADLDDLYHWSITEPAAFWQAVWRFGEVRAEREAEQVLLEPGRMPGARWFEGARLNFADNLLRRRDEATALWFFGENRVREQWSYRQLYDTVSRLAQALRAQGVAPGDRVAGLVPNMPLTLAAMLATASIGAVWSSCSPDFGVEGVLDRFGQIGPTVLFAADGYFYNGKVLDCRPRLARLATALPSVRQVVVWPYVHDEPEVSGIRNGCTLAEFIAPYPAGDIRFEPMPFEAPLYILYSSGTTGTPKCIVHGAGGTLLQHLKEHLLHGDLKRGDRLFYYTTCGWMMWNWMVSGLAAGAALVLYDGAPLPSAPPGHEILWQIVRELRVTHFGTSAKYLSALEKAGGQPGRSGGLSALRFLYSTGSPLLPDSYDYVYREIKAELALCSISGGTDILSCFALGSPVAPVYRGELQMRGLGMAVQVWDQEGKAVVGQKGELVCVAPFPSMPVGFWNDPDGSRYRAAYFVRFPGVWVQGDYAELTPRGGLVIHGRSDAVLNPGGVRIGTAEIYRQVETVPAVEEAVCIGQEWENDVRVILFVKLRQGLVLDGDLQGVLRDRIRTHTTPRHVPARIVQVPEIPRTLSGKIVELAVRNVVHGRPVTNLDSLANPRALDHFRHVPELQR